MFNLNLQLFADAGTLVNATGSYVNAYTGATTAFSGKDTMNPTIKTFYDTELLDNARIEMFYAQFAKKVPLPANNGKRVEFRKWNTFPAAKKLEEGVIPQGEKFGMTSMYGAIHQFGLYTAITDVLELHGYDNVILGAKVCCRYDHSQIVHDVAHSRLNHSSEEFIKSLVTCEQLTSS